MPSGSPRIQGFTRQAYWRTLSLRAGRLRAQHHQDYVTANLADDGGYPHEVSTKRDALGACQRTRIGTLGGNDRGSGLQANGTCRYGLGFSSGFPTVSHQISTVSLLFLWWMYSFSYVMVFPQKGAFYMITSFNKISGNLGSLFFSDSLLVCVFMDFFVFLSSELPSEGKCQIRTTGRHH